jgi:hypothetical protein
MRIDRPLAMKSCFFRMFTLLPLLAVVEAFAVSCDPKAMSSPDEVFVGTVIAQQDWRRLPEEDESSATERHIFQVEKTIKGKKRKAIVVETIRRGGFPFEIGKRYKVHARDFATHGIPLLADVCGGTEPLPNKTERKAN